MFAPFGDGVFRLIQIGAGLIMLLTLLPLLGITSMSEGTTFKDALLFFLILGGLVLVMEFVIRARRGFR